MYVCSAYTQVFMKLPPFKQDTVLRLLRDHRRRVPSFNFTTASEIARAQR